MGKLVDQICFPNEITVRCNKCNKKYDFPSLFRKLYKTKTWAKNFQCSTVNLKNIKCQIVNKSKTSSSTMPQRRQRRKK